MNDFFTWEMLATFAGATAATALITQGMKGIGFLSKIPTQIVSFIIAVLVLFLTTAAIQGFGAEWTVWALIPFNAVVVSLAANGAYTGVKRITDSNK